MNEIIVTERLSLRRWREEDADDLYRHASDSRVCELALWPRHTSVEMSRHVINEFFIPNEYNFAIVFKESGEVIGCIGLVPAGEEHYPAGDREREVGYWIGFPYWGNGLATEALKSLSAWLGNVAGIKSILLTTDVRNKGSRRVAEKCGFQLIGTYRHEGIETMVYRLAL